MSRPEHIRCIKQSTVNKLSLTWCNRTWDQFEWCFLDIDHAANNGAQNQRLVACPQCVEAITQALNNGN
jgi:hypothetical protein